MKKPLYNYKEHILWNADELWHLSPEERKTIELETREGFTKAKPNGCPVVEKRSCLNCDKDGTCKLQNDIIRQKWREAENNIM